MGDDVIDGTTVVLEALFNIYRDRGKFVITDNFQKYFPQLLWVLRNMNLSLNFEPWIKSYPDCFIVKGNDIVVNNKSSWIIKARETNEPVRDILKIVTPYCENLKLKTWILKG